MERQRERDRREETCPILGTGGTASQWHFALSWLLGTTLLAACAGSGVDEADALIDSAWAQRRLVVVMEAESTPHPAPDSGMMALPSEPTLWKLDSILQAIRWANPTLAVANARLAEARAVREEALAAYLPSLTLGLQYVATSDPAQAFALLLQQQKLNLGPTFDPTPGMTENVRKEVRLDWPLFAPGRSSSKSAAEEGVQAARFAREALEHRLLNAGVQACIGLRAARDLERVAEETTEVVARRLEQTRRRQEEGAALRADVLRLEVRLAAARQEAAQATFAVRTAESALNHLMGRAAEAPLELASETLEIGTSLPPDLRSTLAIAREERLDLQAKAHEVRASGFQRRAAHAAWTPALGAFAAYDIDGTKPAIDTSLDSTTLGLALVLPISAGTSARIHRSRAAEQRARAELAELALSVNREVRDSFEEVRAAERTRDLAEAAVGAAEEAYRILATAQDAGGATVTDVLEAENARNRARVQLVAARAGVQIARAKLVAATGGVR